MAFAAPGAGAGIKRSPALKRWSVLLPRCPLPGGAFPLVRSRASLWFIIPGFGYGKILATSEDINTIKTKVLFLPKHLFNQPFFSYFKTSRLCFNAPIAGAQGTGVEPVLGFRFCLMLDGSTGRLSCGQC